MGLADLLVDTNCMDMGHPCINMNGGRQDVSTFISPHFHHKVNSSKSHAFNFTCCSELPKAASSNDFTSTVN